MPTCFFVFTSLAFIKIKQYYLCNLGEKGRDFVEDVVVIQVKDGYIVCVLKGYGSIRTLGQFYANGRVETWIEVKTSPDHSQVKRFGEDAKASLHEIFLRMHKRILGISHQNSFPGGLPYTGMQVTTGNIRKM